MPRPTEGESKTAFVERCAEVRQSEHPSESKPQSRVICASMYDRYKRSGSITKDK